MKPKKEIREIANGSTYFYETERTLEFKQQRAQRAQDVFDMAFDEEGELRTDEQVADDVMSRLSTWYETGDKTKLGAAEETLADLYKKVEEDPVNILRWPQSQVWRDNIEAEFKAMPQQIAEAKPKIAAVEDDVVDILVPATNRELTKDEFNALRDAKERFTQALPESYRPRVEDMDMNEFVQMVLHNKLERDKATAAIGFFDLTEDEIQAMAGRRIGALEGVKEYDAHKHDDSWAWDRLSASWENAAQGSSAGWKHATLKKEGILIFEERDDELVKLMGELVNGKEGADNGRLLQNWVCQG